MRIPSPQPVWGRRRLPCHIASSLEPDWNLEAVTSRDPDPLLPTWRKLIRHQQSELWNLLEHFAALAHPGLMQDQAVMCWRAPRRWWVPFWRLLLPLSPFTELVLPQKNKYLLACRSSISFHPRVASIPLRFTVSSMQSKQQNIFWVKSKCCEKNFCFFRELDWAGELFRKNRQCLQG